MKPGIEEISESLRKLIDDAEALLRNAAAGTGEKLDQADEHAREALQRCCGHLRRARDEARSRARKLDGTVHAHPWRALALTAIVAFIAGLAVRRR
jgi:ElaB/YqjD/DUF883 family membrane-anchored ribosome-binding protein